MTLEDYILAHIDPEPEYLHRLWRATNLHLNYPRMASGHFQGRVLHMLTQMIRPKRVLEIGTFTGYSTLCMASALEGDGRIDTIEINDEQEDFTRPWFENSPWAERIGLHIGDALEMLNGECSNAEWLSGECFDLVYIDADKRHYLDYYHAVRPYVHAGSFLIADNTLWDGHVMEDNRISRLAGAEGDWNESGRILNAKEEQTLGIMRFNDYVAQDAQVQRVIIPLRDGLTIIRIEN